jgi:hypothetical protein
MCVTGTSGLPYLLPRYMMNPLGPYGNVSDINPFSHGFTEPFAGLRSTSVP